MNRSIEAEPGLAGAEPAAAAGAGLKRQHDAWLAALAHTAIFGQLPMAAQTALLANFVWLNLAGGDTLFSQGDEADALYVLCEGSLGVCAPAVPGGPERLLGMIAPGETVGEASLLTQRKRNATVRALRDCSLLRLERGEVLEGLLREHPEAVLGSLQLVMERLLQRDMIEPMSAPRTFALLPAHAGLPVRETAERLRLELAAMGPCLVVDAALGQGQDLEWHGQRERAHRFVLYTADGSDPAWHATCLRQADELLMLAHADDPPRPWPEGLCRSGADALHRTRRLLLLGKGDRPTPGRAAGWLDQFGPSQTSPDVALHHLCTQADHARLARFLARRARGLVLSGGGARGFAHIGVVRALRELGLPIDAIGGTSIGAIVGAGTASGWDHRELLERLRETFLRGHPLRDLTLPLISLTRGSRTTRLLRQNFGERRIEDLPQPFFRVSSNLTRGCADVHSRGPLWQWLRAGAAIPGILPPLLHGGMVHVDGAVMNNLPTDLMRDRGVHEVVAVEIGSSNTLHATFEDAALPTLPWLTWQWLRGRQWPSLFAILTRAATAHSENGNPVRRSLATHLLMPSLGDLGLLDWKSYEVAIDSGYRCAMDYFSRPAPDAEQAQRALESR
jgi:NTE family protein